MLMNAGVFYPLVWAQVGDRGEMLDSLVALLPQKIAASEDSSKIHYFNALSFAYRLYSKEPHNAVRFADSARRIAARLPERHGEATAWHNLGLAYFAQSQYAKALEAHEQALAIREQLGDKRGMSRSLSGKGLVYEQQGSYGDALAMYEQALQQGEEAKDTIGLAVVYDNIGKIYRLQEKYEQSLAFHRKAAALHETTGLTTNLAYSQMGIGAALLALKRYDEALESYTEALVIRTRNRHQIGIAATLNAIGTLHFQRGDFPKAEQAHLEAIAIQETIKDKNGLAVSYYELGRVYEALRKIEAALEAGIHALANANAIGAKVIVYQSSLLVSRMYKLLGRSNEALAFMEQAMEVKDAVLNEQKAAKIAEIEARFELRSKQQQIELLAKDKELTTITRNSLISGLVLLLALSTILFVRYREKQRSNKEILRQQGVLEEQAKEIEMINTELQAANEALNEKNEELVMLNEEKNEFLGIAAHDLKNPLGSIKLLSEILSEHGATRNDATVVEMAELIRRSVGQMLEMTGNLLDINAIEQGKVRFDIHRLNCGQVLREAMHRFTTQAAVKNIRLGAEIPAKHIYALADEHALMQSLENLLSNAIKYSPFGTNVRVVLEECLPLSSAEFPTPDDDDSVDVDNTVQKRENIFPEGYARITVADEGPGLTDEDKRKLFGKFARLSAQPTAGEHSTGLGLSIVKRMVEQMNGRVYCISEPKKGARFIVELPLAPPS